MPRTSKPAAPRSWWSRTAVSWQNKKFDFDHDSSDFLFPKQESRWAQQRQDGDPMHSICYTSSSWRSVATGLWKVLLRPSLPFVSLISVHNELLRFFWLQLQSVHCSCRVYRPGSLLPSLPMLIALALKRAERLSICWTTCLRALWRSSRGWSRLLAFNFSPIELCDRFVNHWLQDILHGEVLASRVCGEWVIQHWPQHSVATVQSVGGWAHQFGRGLDLACPEVGKGPLGAQSQDAPFIHLQGCRNLSNNNSFKTSKSGTPPKNCLIFETLVLCSTLCFRMLCSGAVACLLRARSPTKARCPKLGSRRRWMTFASRCLLFKYLLSGFLCLEFHLQRFFLKHLDRELNGMLETTVPPLDVMNVSAFRSSIQKWSKQARVYSWYHFDFIPTFLYYLPTSKTKAGSRWQIGSFWKVRSPVCSLSHEICLNHFLDQAGRGGCLSQFPPDAGQDREGHRCFDCALHWKAGWSWPVSR